MASLGDYARAAAAIQASGGGKAEYEAWRAGQTQKKKGLTSKVKSVAKSVGTGAAKVATKVGKVAGQVIKAPLKILSGVGGLLGLSAREKAMEDSGDAPVRTRQVAKRRDAGHGVVSYTGEEEY